MYGLNLRIWTVFAGGAGFDSQQQQYFLLFLVKFLSSNLFFLSFSFAYFSIDACVLHYYLFLLVVMVVELPYALKRSFFGLFGLKQACLPNHSLFGYQ